jgi:metal-responsive CopG/Arc/MetJ family transcriptional regulator
MGRGVTAAVVKVTISLPRDIVAYADRRARSEGTSRSRVIAEALERARAAEEEALAAEGYQFYAQEAADFAEASQGAVAEAIGRAG